MALSVERQDYLLKANENSTSQASFKVALKDERLDGFRFGIGILEQRGVAKLEKEEKELEDGRVEITIKGTEKDTLFGKAIANVISAPLPLERVREILRETLVELTDENQYIRNLNLHYRSNLIPA